MDSQEFEATLAAMTADLRECRTDSVERCFRGQNAPAPTVRFAPGAGTLGDTTLEILLAYWTQLCDGRDAGAQDLPAQIDFDPLAISVTLPYVMLLDVVEGGADFRYRVYGREIAARFGRDLTGMLLSEAAVHAHIAAFFLAVYRAALSRREAILTEHAPPRTISVTSWRRLILPLAAGDASISRLVVGNIPGTWRAASGA